MASASGSRWESSSRPLVVRTVWVNGLRHAILSPPPGCIALPRAAAAADPDHVRTSSPSSASATSTASEESERPPPPPAAKDEHELARCLVRWKLVVGRGDDGGDDDDEGADADAEEEGDDPEESRQHHDVPHAPAPTLLGSYTTSYLPLAPGPESGPESPGDGPVTDGHGAEGLGPSPGGPETSGRRGESSSDLNPLSERVLQWLDLAGKVADSTVPVPRAPRRHVSTACPAASRRLHAAAVVVTAAPPRPRRFYPVAASEVTGPAPRVALSAARRSASVEANLPPRAPAPASRTPTPPTPPPPPPPLIQTFQHVPTGAARTWHGGLSQSRPQLHIFVPTAAVSEKGVATQSAAELLEQSDCESGISDA